MSSQYRIIRMFERNYRPRVIKRGLTLEEAQAYCADPETASETAKGARARRFTTYYGPWYDGFEVDTGRSRRRS